MMVVVATALAASRSTGAPPRRKTGHRTITLLLEKVE